VSGLIISPKLENLLPKIKIKKNFVSPAGVLVAPDLGERDSILSRNREETAKNYRFLPPNAEYTYTYAYRQ